ncbi:MAG TPA: hypothetical protein VIK86_08940 [Candidatus Paceibacterota bacterium]
MKNIEDTEVVESDETFTTKVIVSIIVGILVIGGGIYFGIKNNRENRIKEELNSKEVLNDFTLNGNNCYDRSKYFVITRADLTENAGDDILVKYKKDKHQKIDCKYLLEKNDFELLNTPIGDGPAVSYAQHFSFIKDNLIIVDEGTGTNRDFVIYDLDKQEQVFTDNYSAGLFDLKDNILTYWRKTNDVPNKENCSRVDEYMKMGGAKIEGKITLDIFNPSEKKFEAFRCSYEE